MPETVTPETLKQFEVEQLAAGARRSRLPGYVIVVIAVPAVGALQWLAGPALSSTSFFLLLLVAVVTGAWAGGAGPALLGVFLGFVAALLRPELARLPVSESAPVLESFLFAGLGVAVSLLARRFTSMRRLIAQECDRFSKMLLQGEEKYRAFVTNSSEAIWLFEGEPPVPTDLPEDEQIEWIYRAGRLSKSNSAMALLYGFASPEEINGTPLDVLMPRSEKQNVEYLRQFIRSGYRLTDFESHEVDREGNRLILLNNLIGIVENGHLARAWGTSRNVTRQREAENALRLSEERFRLSAQAVSAIIYERDIRTGTVVRSAGLYEVLGFTPEEAEPTVAWWTNRIHPDDLVHKDKLAEVMEGGTDYFSAEYRVRHRDGRWIHVWDRGLVVRDSTGKALRLYGSAMDITSIVEARRRIEEMAEAAELHFRQLEGVFQSMSEGVAVFTSAGHLISMNTAMMRMHGFEPGEDYQFCAEDLSACFESRLPDGKRPPLQNLPIMRALQGEEVVGYELEVRRTGQNQYRMFSYNATPVRNHEGKIVLAVATARDITEQKSAENALRQSEIHYRTLADTVPCIVYTAVPAVGIDYCNRVWYEYTGLTPETTLGYAGFAAVHPEDKNALLSDWADALLTGKPFTREYRLQGAAGEYRWFLGRAVALRNEAGRVLKWFGTSVDIEDQKRAETEIRLANEQLAATRDEAIEANRAKSAFLANMSHELRTPLTAIIGYAEMIEEDAREKGDKELLQDLGNISSSGHHLLTLINDLLDLAKVEAGRMVLDLGEFDIPQLVTEIADTARPLARSNSNELVVACPADLGTMTADPVKVRQALINLLSNACKFTEQGRVELAVARRCAEGRNWVEFRVTDSGIGIGPDQLDRIFREFVQIDTAASRKHGGTGLGLAITKRFCQMMGGDVTAESEPGHGSTFMIRLPAKVEAD